MITQDNIKLKERQVNALSEKILKAKTLILASIKNLPSKQFQEIKKTMRKQADIKVAKKNIMIRAIKNTTKDNILQLENYIKSDCVFVISDIEGFKLAGILSKRKTPVFAKTGQIVNEDIEIKKGPTDLVPGPAISELGAVGLQISVEGGKIAIKQSKIIIKKGGVINQATASLLQKLNIQPFKIGLDILAIYDVEKEKIYTDVEINSEKNIQGLKNAVVSALGLSQKISYYCKETIVYFLSKASLNEKSLSKHINKNG